jgi:hypothetical protein
MSTPVQAALMVVRMQPGLLGWEPSSCIVRLITARHSATLACWVVADELCASQTTRGSCGGTAFLNPCADLLYRTDPIGARGVGNQTAARPVTAPNTAGEIASYMLCALHVGAVCRNQDTGT